MSMPRLSRPSLKITRRAEHNAADSFTFDVWSPFTGRYQAVPSLDEGMRRIEQLAGLIHQMWARKHPKNAELLDAPQPGEAADARWAELRINPTVYRSYDIRRSGRAMWLRAAGERAAVTEMICHNVGYARPAT